MTRKDFSPAQMEERIARFATLTPSRRAFVDVMLPDHERDFFNIIGRGVTEDSNLKPAISDVTGGFNMSIVRSQPGKRGALHDHDTIEVFVVLKGRYTIIWGDKGEHEVTLDEHDVISVPTGIMRCFRNDGDSEGMLLVVFGGEDAGRVEWTDGVVEEAERLGWSLTKEGDLKEVKTGQGR